MWRIGLILAGGLYLATAVYMWAAPQSWYEITPGVAMMGPFNLHFIRDIALVFLLSAGALAWGGLKNDKTAAVLGAAWPCLHAAYHIAIWLGRGVPIDTVAVTNLLGIQVPAWFAMACALKMTAMRAGK